AVISGSSALHYLLPQREMTWSPHDLDIYTTEKTTHFLLVGLKLQGYQMININTEDEIQNYCLHIIAIFTLVHNKHKVDVFISSSTTPISPVFWYHSTALMNFITHNSIFCAYPHLTLKGLSLVNPFMIFSQPLK
ncbi:hypothetical protein M404DRAFT_145026, partial [Pisolithus tinctorius Marx 270]